MDKVREILAVLKKHHFWILSVVVTGVILGAWYKATATLAAKYQTEKSSIEQTFTSLSSITADPLHPNPTFKTGVEEERDKLKKLTDAEWKRLYERQRSVFVWPAELSGFQEWEDSNRATPMTSDMLRNYQNFLELEFPKLELLVNARREKNPGASTSPLLPTPGMRPPFGQSGLLGGPEMIGIVEWDPADFLKMKTQLKTWGTKRPEQIEVTLCHESLAVYRSLLKAIAAVNEGATDNENATIKKITQLDIGAAASLPGPFDMSGVVMPAELAGAPEGGFASSPYAAGPTGAPMTGAPGEAQAIPKAQILLEGRYLDGAGAPLGADAAQNSPPFAEFKLMKVRLILVVDQRGIPKVLAELANADLGVEVHQVRINPQNTTVVQNVKTKLASAAAASSPMPGGGRGEGGPTRPPGPGYGTGRPPGYGTGRPTGREGGASAYGASMTSGTETNPNDATVEIKGIIYIYNRFDEAKTGTGTDTTEVDKRTMFGFAGAASGGAPTATAAF